MFDRIVESTGRIDAKTSKAVTEAIGVGLRTDVRPGDAKLPAQLQLLLDRLRAQETDA